MKKYIAIFPILYLFLDTKRRPVFLITMRWWDQEVLVFSGRPAEERGGGWIRRQGGR